MRGAGATGTGRVMRQPRCQPPSNPQKIAFCAVKRPTQSPTTKHTRPNIRARSEARAHSRITAVVMAARRLVNGSVRQEVSHNFNQMQANGLGQERIWASVDKKGPAEAGQIGMGRGSVDLLQKYSRGGHRCSDKGKRKFHRVFAHRQGNRGGRSRPRAICPARRGPGGRGISGLRDGDG
jgi:hypothetical protein